MPLDMTMIRRKETKDKETELDKAINNICIAV